MTISAAFKEELFAQESDDVAIMLLTVDDGVLPEPLRFSSDATTRLSVDPLSYGTISRGDIYLYLPFQFTFPQDRADVPPRVELVMDNIERTLIPVLESFIAPPRILVEVVAASDLHWVQKRLPGMLLSNVTYTADAITGTLIRNALDKEPFPGGRFTPAYFPGLF